ncbi:hypothetical protein ABK040_009942 [Willaertia magna]
MSIVYTVGYGGFGGLALNTTKTQEQFKLNDYLTNTLQNIKEISLGLWHTLIITKIGKIYGVGRNRYGALGLGNPDDLDQINFLIPQLITKPFIEINEITKEEQQIYKVIQAKCGKTHSLILTDDGTVFGCGFGIGVGHGVTTLTCQPEPLQYLFQFKIQQVSAGEYHSCCLDNFGNVFSWGLNNRNKPLIIKNMKNKEIINVECGGQHVLLLSKNGKIYGFGKNSDYQLGKYHQHSKNGIIVGVENTFISEEDAIEIPHPNMEEWIKISCGYKHSLALDKFGNLYLWGYFKNEKKYDTFIEPLKIELPNMSQSLNIKSIFSGYSSFGILTKNGKLFTFGNNIHYHLGHGHNKYINKLLPIKELNAIYIDNVFMGPQSLMFLTGLGTSHDFEKLLKNNLNSDNSITLNGDGGNNLSDVCIYLEGDDIPINVHACILYYRSNYFKYLLNNSNITTINGMDNKINIVMDKNVMKDKEILNHVLELLYTNMTINIKKENEKEVERVMNDYIFNNNLFIEDNNEDYNKHSKIDVIAGCTSGVLDEYMNDFINIYKYSKYSDIEIELINDNNNILKLHKCILSCRCDYFKIMFTTNTFIESLQKRIPFENITMDIFEIILKYLYTGHEPTDDEIKSEQLISLLELCTRINLDNLKIIIERKIIKYLDLQNVIDILQISDLCQAENVKNSCIQLIAKNVNYFNFNELENILIDLNLFDKFNILKEKLKELKENELKYEEEVFNYIKEQEEAFKNLLDENDRQHLIDQFNEEKDLEMIETILNGRHDTAHPQHYQHHSNTNNNNGNTNNGTSNNNNNRNNNGTNANSKCNIQ